jgi:hypothetical protein
MVSSPGLNGSGQTSVDSINPEGSLGPRVQLEIGFNGADMVFDEQGRAIAVYAASDFMTVFTVERDASRCTAQRLAVAPCLKVDAQGAGSCDDPSAVLTAAGDLFFGVAGTVGVAIRP